MVVLVISRTRQALARSRLYSSVVGDSMLARLRNSTIALLGTVTAVGLGLVVFISQLGVPGVFNGAIPDGPSGSGAVRDAIALTQPAPVGGSRPGLGRHRASPRVRPSSPGPSGPAAVTDLGSSNQVGHGPAANPPSVTGQPPSTPAPAPEPVAEPEAPPPAPTIDTTGSPKPDSSARSEKAPPAKSKSKTRDHSRSKKKGQADTKSDTSSSGGSQGHHSAKPKQHPGASSKPPDSSPGKPKPSSAGDSPGKPSKSDPPPPKPSDAPPSSEPTAKGPPEAGGKEAPDAGKSDRSHH
jgi:hypothetical protein